MDQVQPGEKKKKKKDIGHGHANEIISPQLKEPL